MREEPGELRQRALTIAENGEGRKMAGAGRQVIG